MEKEEVKVPCGGNRSTGSPRQEDLGGEPPLLPDHCSSQDMTSEGGVAQIQREEQRQEETMTVEESGGCQVERYLHRCFPRGLTTSSYPDRQRERQAEDPRGPGPFFFFGGANGAEIVCSYCERRGWRRIYNKHRDDIKLKWCEIKSAANYRHLREGEQLVYQIPNNKVLTTKIGLLSSLREYERVSSKVGHGRVLRRLKMEEFIPTTYRMDVREEREAFFAQHEAVSSSEKLMWICKPTGLNQGRGIFLLKTQEDVAALRLKLQDTELSRTRTSRTSHRQPQARIVQHYIQKPLLLDGRKFDVRCYLLIASTTPYMVFFRHGYVRLTCDLYDAQSNNLCAHLTNQHMQKKNPLYSQLKEDTVWSMESFNSYVNDRFHVAKGLPRDWVLGTFAKRMQQITTQCFYAVKSKLECRLGFFDLIGCDFMIDEDFKVWLLEMNCNPALHTNCVVLQEVIPSTVVEALDLTLEIFNKCRHRQTILPLCSQRDFVLLYNGASLQDPAPACSRSNTKNDSNQKSTRKTHRTDPGRCSSDVSSSSPYNSLNKGSSSKSGHRPTTFTPASPGPPSATGQSRSHYSSGQTTRNKSPRHRVELKLSNCSLNPQCLKAGGDGRQKMRVIMSLSPSSLHKGISGSSETTTPVLPHAGAEDSL